MFVVSKLTVLGLHAALVFALPRAIVKKHADELRDSYDFVIAGGGTAGLTVADRLSEAFPNRTVLVVEYGQVEEAIGSFEPPDSPPQADAFQFNSLPIQDLDNRVANVRMGRTVGGSSAINGQVFDRGSRQDYDDWMEVAGEAWENSTERWDWKGLSPFFKKSVTFTPPSDEVVDQYGYRWDEAAYGGHGPINSSFPPFQWPIQKVLWNAWVETGVRPRTECANGDKDGLCWVPTSQDPITAKRSYSGIGHYQNVIGSRSNYHLLVKHKVLRVVYSNGDASDGPPKVEIRNLETNEVEYVSATKEVVISAGTAHTPLILQRSGIAWSKFLEKAGVDVVVDLPGVGFNLQDHPGPTVNATLSKPIEPSPETLETNTTFAQEAVELYAQRPARGPYTLAYANSIVYLPLPNITDSWCDIVDKVQQQTETPHGYLPDDVPAEVVAGYKAQLQVLAKSYADPTHPILEIPFVNAASAGTILLKPLSRGSIFMNLQDPDDFPVVDYRTASNPVDMDILVSFVRFFRRFLNTTILREYGVEEVAPGPEVQSDEGIRRFLASEAWPTWYHPCCTASMMPRHLGGVVDTDLKVYGTKGLRVADLSIANLLPGTHTSSTAYAIGEKAADIIIRAWS